MEKVKKICRILLGNILYAFGVSYFIVPAGLISGGITGLSLFLNKAFSLPLSPCIWAVCFLFFLCGLIMLGKVMLFGQGKVQILIYSEAFEEINQLIVSEFHRGTTILYGEGGYRRENTKIIQTVIPQRSLFTIRERVLKIDPQAFIVINPVSEVNGRGFTLKAS